MPKWIRVIVVSIALLVLAGCGPRLDAFKELGVEKKEVPKYNISGEITDKTPPTQYFATIKPLETKNFSETQARQIIADYINIKLKGNKNVDIIIVNTVVNEEKYIAAYYRDEKALNLNPPEEKTQKFPAIVFTKGKK
jgi:protein involved in sex pheromone biosynthesis